MKRCMERDSPYLRINKRRAAAKDEKDILQRNFIYNFVTEEGTTLSMLVWPPARAAVFSK